VSPEHCSFNPERIVQRPYCSYKSHGVSMICFGLRRRARQCARQEGVDVSGHEVVEAHVSRVWPGEVPERASRRARYAQWQRQLCVCVRARADRVQEWRSRCRAVRGVFARRVAYAERPPACQRCSAATAIMSRHARRRCEMFRHVARPSMRRSDTTFRALRQQDAQQADCLRDSVRRVRSSRRTPRVECE